MLLICLRSWSRSKEKLYDDDGRFNAWPAYRTWLQNTDPVIPAANISNLPVWVLHDGVDPGHGPLSHSVDFVEQARAVGNHPKFERIRHPVPRPSSAVFARQLSWLVQQHRAQPEPFTISADAMIGPLAQVFSRRFVLVEATGGNENDRAANEKLSTQFQEAWRRTNFGPCRVIKDRELTADEEQRSHLVLLGNAVTNSVWGRLSPNLPVEMESKKISIGGRVYEGEALALQAWFPHPAIKGKKVVLIGAAYPEDAVFGTLELSLDGWFDYAIWGTNHGLSTLVAANGYPVIQKTP